MTEHYVAEVGEIPVGGRKIIQVRKISIGVFNVNGEFYALMNFCPHIGAELCKGLVSGTNLDSDVYEFIYGKDQEIIRCPWHGWEFDIKTGRSLFDDKVKTKSYEVKVEDGKVMVLV